MIMYQKILCAIEASDEGKKVLAKAFEISQLCGAELFVANIVPYTLLPKDYQKELKNKIIPKIEKIAKKYSLSKKHVTIKFGKPYEEICALASKKNADLIVLGTHSKKGVHALVGSTANAVSNHANCDVTLIKIL